MGYKIRNGILLTAVFAAVLIPAVFLNTLCGYFALLFLLIFFCISGICLGSLWRGVSVECQSRTLSCQRGGQTEIGLSLKNQSRISCAGAKAQIVISDLFGGTDNSQKIHFSIGGRDQIDLGFGMDMNHVGIFKIGLTEVCLHDFSGVLHRRKPLNGNYQVTVLPRIHTMDELQSAKAFSEADREMKVTTPGGMDYTGVREYVPGDPMKQIHWKLSAHTRDYLTKQQEADRQQEYMIVLDFAAETGKDRELGMQMNDCLIETALSVGEGLRRMEGSCHLLFVDRMGQLAKTAQIHPDAYEELLSEFCFIQPEPSADFPDGAAMLASRAVTTGSSNVILVTSRITEQMLDELQRIRAQQRSAELYMILPAEWNSRQREGIHARLHRLEESGVAVHLISTAWNMIGREGEA